MKAAKATKSTSRRSSGRASNANGNGNGSTNTPKASTNRRRSNVSVSQSSTPRSSVPGTPERSPPWTEPELPDPKPISTGYPLGAVPPSKLLKKEKRDSLSSVSSAAFANAKANGTDTSTVRAQNNSSGNSEESSRQGTPPQADPQKEQKEKKLKVHLKTSRYDNLVKESDIRRSGRTVGKPVEYFPPPPPGDFEDTDTTSPIGSSKSKNAKADINASKRSRSNTPTAATPPNGRLEVDNEQPKVKRIKLTGLGNNPTRPRSTRQQEIQQKEDVEKEEENKSGLINNDYCSACGGTGQFLCCEACPRSFHFTCVDPPLDESTLPEGEWLCRQCQVKKDPPVPFKNGIWSQLLDQAEVRNPTVFLLPKGLRERYEGVITTSQGEYDIEPVKSNRRNITVKDADDPLKTLDKQGNPILCYRCKGSALNGVQMLTCDYCPLAFHADCVDTKSVFQGPAGKWKCPNHYDQATKPPRRTKRASIEDPAVVRGFKNNGDIEVTMAEDEPSTDRLQVVPPSILTTNFVTDKGVAARQAPELARNFEMDNVVYRLPEEAIKLDFVDVVQQEKEAAAEEERNNAANTDGKILNTLHEISLKNYKERQVIRDLCHMQVQGTKQEAVGLAASNLSMLVDAALANIDVGEREQLMALQQVLQIKGRKALFEFLSK